MKDLIAILLFALLFLASMDFEFCNTMLRDDDRALKIEMGRGILVMKSLGMVR